MSKTGTSVAGDSQMPQGAHNPATPGGTSIAGGTGTAIAGGSGTAVASGGANPQAGANQSGIPELPEYIINGHRFTKVKALGVPSGEGRVFVVENGGNQFALKIYRAGHTPDTAVLDAVKKAGGGFMVYLREHGAWINPTPPGLAHYFELMDFCPYGSLGDIRIRTDEEFKAIATGMAFCIKQCHDNGFIHRDIKPENFLMTVPQIDPNAKSTVQFVVSDFGIGRLMGGKKTIITDLGKTGRYASPEACYSSNNVTVEMGFPTDYYSMGLTLLAMCIGVNTFPIVCKDSELDNYKRLGTVMEQLGPMIRLSDYSKSLLAALLENNPDDRADFKAIQEWIAGKTLKTKQQAAADAANAFKYVFDDSTNKIAHSTEELAKLMMTDIEYAKRELYRGAIVRALERLGRTRIAGDIDNIVTNVYKQESEKEVGVYAACLCLDQSMPFIDRDGKECRTVTEIADALWRNRAFYATDLKNSASRLWAYLQARGDDNLKKFAGIYRPMIVKSGQHGVYALCKALKPGMPYYNPKGATMVAPKDIAEDLWNLRNSYSKDLADPNHSLWTFLKGLGTNGAKLAKDYPSRIKDHGEYALYGLCLSLDEETPFFAKNGSKCYDVSEIAQELWDLDSDYKKEVIDPMHPLWTYMRSWHDDEWTRIANEYPQKIKDRPAVWFYELIYRMDPTKPYLVKFVDDEKWHHINNFNALKTELYKHGIHDASLSLLCEADFVTWLTVQSDPKVAQRGAMLEKLAKQLGSNASKNGWYLLYSIIPELSLTLQTDTKAADYIATNEQIGNALCYQINTGKYFSNAVGAKIDLIATFKDPSAFKGSRLEQFMNARKMGNYVNGILSIIDVNRCIAQHKSAPYDGFTARWKVVDYLGGKLKYVTAAGKEITDPRQLANLPSGEVSSEVSRGLPQFCSLWFHEGKGKSFSIKDLTSYYNFLNKYIPTAYNMRQSASMRNQLLDKIDERNRAWNTLGNIRKWVMILCLVPMIGIVTWMIILTFTSGTGMISSAVEAVGGVVAVIMAIGGALAGLSGGIIGAVLGGMAGYWLTVLIFWLLSAIAPILLALLAIAGAVYFIIRLNKFTSDTYISSEDEYNKLYDQANTYIVCHGLGTASRTFGSNNIDPTQTFQSSINLAASQKKDTVKAAVGMVILTIVTLGLGLLFAGAFSSSDKHAYEDTEEVIECVETDPIDLLAGSYSGTLKGKDASLTITKSSGVYPLEAKVTCGSKTYNCQGKTEGSTVILYVNGVADNRFKGELANNVYSGDYQPYTGAARQQFEFTKL